MSPQCRGRDRSSIHADSEDADHTELVTTATLLVVSVVVSLCADPGFSSGGGVHFSQSDKKSSDNVFTFFFFLFLSLFYRSQKVNLKEIYHISRFQRGSSIFQGGSNFFQGGGGSPIAYSL